MKAVHDGLGAPVLIIDKSVLQALDEHEISLLARLYTVNLTPILFFEIIGDLTKLNTGGLVQPSEAMRLAKKATQSRGFYNQLHHELIALELEGEYVPTNYQIVLDRAHRHTLKDGRAGIVFEESHQEQAAMRWQRGDFGPSDIAFAEEWRSHSRTFDLEYVKRHYSQASDRLSDANNFQELVQRVEKLFLDRDDQTEALSLLLSVLFVDPADRSPIVERYKLSGVGTIKEFAPFAYHCAKVELSFRLGLARNFLGTRATNQVDKEYLCYLPFCMVFCSNDKFHTLTAPCFMTAEQTFLSGKDLKDDLSRIANWMLKSKTPKSSPELNNVNEILSALPDLATASLWRKYVHPGDRKKYSAWPIGLNMRTDEIPEFLACVSHFSKSGLCPCGSLQPFKACCGSEIN